MSAPALHPALVPPSRVRALAAWMSALMLAWFLDGPIARHVEPIAFAIKHSVVAELLKLPGHFAFMLAIAGALGVFHAQRWRGAAVLFSAFMLAGTFYGLLKWPVGRVRPITRIDPLLFDHFRNGLPGFIQGGTSFPSGHACVVFAMAACLAWLLPRGRWAFYAIASLIALERVLELAHYLSDVVAAAGFGLLAFHVAKQSFDLHIIPRLTPAAAPDSRAISAVAAS